MRGQMTKDRLSPGKSAALFSPEKRRICDEISLDFTRVLVNAYRFNGSFYEGWPLIGLISQLLLPLLLGLIIFIAELWKNHFPLPSQHVCVI